MSAAQHSDGGSVSTEGGRGSGRTGTSSSTESAEGEEQEDSSSSSLSPPKEEIVEDALSSFRNEWQKELEISQEKKDKVESYDKENPSKEMEKATMEEEARLWFMQGVENEQRGKLYEAIHFYRKAVQLVPDIEFKLYEAGRAKQKESVKQEHLEDELSEYVSDGREELSDSGDEGEDSAPELMARLHKYLARSRAFCAPKYEQRETHISALPMEVLLYVLRWVVSYDLDMRALEMCSMVSRGFYVCSRDSEIWRLACLKVWGVNCGGLSNYTSWREMYLQRPRLNFHGCYISKTTYLRHGENSFQDQWYRPWHLVEYFRYLRFFPEGTVLMLTTPDEPMPVLAHLKTRQTRHSSVLVGHYRLTDDRVALVLKRQELSVNNRFRRKNIQVDLSEQSFHIELKVASGKSRCKVNNQLLWQRYSVVTKRGSTETCTNFEVMNNKFPPFWFSKVKSYTAESDRPLI